MTEQLSTWFRVYYEDGVGGERNSYECRAFGPNHAVSVTKDQHPEKRIIVLKVKKIGNGG